MRKKHVRALAIDIVEVRIGVAGRENLVDGRVIRDLHRFGSVRARVTVAHQEPGLVFRDAVLRHRCKRVPKVVRREVIPAKLVGDLLEAAAGVHERHRHQAQNIPLLDHAPSSQKADRSASSTGASVCSFLMLRRALGERAVLNDLPINSRTALSVCGLNIRNALEGHGSISGGRSPGWGRGRSPIKFSSEALDPARW